MTNLKPCPFCGGEAKKMPFVRDPLAWALYHTWKEFNDGKRCD